MLEQVPTIGRIVHYVLAGGIHRPAIITHVWSPTTVNLTVFVVPQEDAGFLATVGRQSTHDVATLTSVGYAENNAVDSWHWPERD